MNQLFLIFCLFLFADLGFASSSKESKPCEQKVKIEGEFSYKKRLKQSKEIEVIKERGELKSTFEGNDQAYETLFFKGLDFESVRLSKIQDNKTVKTEEFQAQKNGEETQINQLVFSKLVLGTSKPFKLKFEFLKNKQIVCHKEILIIEGD
jgi:hypothetical protein